MSRKALRSILIISAAALPVLSAFTWWLLGYGAWIGSSIDVSDQMPLFKLMAVQGFFNGLPISAICLWAAHNLKQITVISNTNLSRYCLLGIISCFVCFIFSFFEIALQSVIFEEGIVFSADKFAYSFQFVIYGIANSAVLIFARLQLKQKMSGETIQEPSLADTFS